MHTHDVLVQHKIKEICNQENQILTTNETRHPTLIFYPFGGRVACFFERVGYTSVKQVT
jgi:hypothetical protein